MANPFLPNLVFFVRPRRVGAAEGWGPNTEQVGPRRVGRDRIWAKPDLAILNWPNLARPHLANFFFGGVDRRGWGQKGLGPEGVVARRGGARTQKKWGSEGVGPKGWGPKPGLHTTARELQTRTFERPSASNTTKIQRKDLQEREKRIKFPAGERKQKREILGLPPFGPFGPPPLRAPTLRTPLGPHPFGPPPLRAPTPSGPHQKKKNWPNAVWPNSVNKNWPNSAK